MTLTLLDSDQVEVEGYMLVREDRKALNNLQTILRKGGGVAIYTTKSLNTDNNWLQEANRSNNNLELVWTLIQNEKQANIAYREPIQTPRWKDEQFIMEMRAHPRQYTETHQGRDTPT